MKRFLQSAVLGTILTGACFAQSYVAGVATKIHSGSSLPVGAGPNEVFILTGSPPQLYICNANPCTTSGQWVASSEIAINLAGTTVDSVPYQSAAGVTSYVGPNTNASTGPWQFFMFPPENIGGAPLAPAAVNLGFGLLYNPPSFSPTLPANISVAIAPNLEGNSSTVNAVPFEQAVNTTSFVGPNTSTSTAGLMLFPAESGSVTQPPVLALLGSGLTYSGGAISATSSGSATNLAGTTVDSVPYQSAAGVTSYVGPNTNASTGPWQLFVFPPENIGGAPLAPAAVNLGFGLLYNPPSFSPTLPASISVTVAPNLEGNSSTVNAVLFEQAVNTTSFVGPNTSSSAPGLLLFPQESGSPLATQAPVLALLGSGLSYSGGVISATGGGGGSGSVDAASATSSTPTIVPFSIYTSYTGSGSSYASTTLTPSGMGIDSSGNVYIPTKLEACATNTCQQELDFSLNSLGLATPASGHSDIACDSPANGGKCHYYQNGTDEGILATLSDTVTSVNSLTGAVTLAAGSNVTITASGNTLTIASSSVTFDNSGLTTPTTNLTPTFPYQYGVSISQATASSSNNATAIFSVTGGAGGAGTSSLLTGGNGSGGGFTGGAGGAGFASSTSAGGAGGGGDGWTLVSGAGGAGGNYTGSNPLRSGGAGGNAGGLSFMAAAGGAGGAGGAGSNGAYGNGGSISLTAGNSGAGGAAGNINLTPGTGGTPGAVVIAGNLDFSSGSCIGCAFGITGTPSSGSNWPYVNGSGVGSFGYPSGVSADTATAGGSLLPQLVRIETPAGSCLGAQYQVGTSVTQYQLVSLGTPSSGNAVIQPAGTSGGPVLGVAQATVAAGSGHLVDVCESGYSPVLFDGTVTAGHIATPSTATGGDATDTNAYTSTNSVPLESGNLGQILTTLSSCSAPCQGSVNLKYPFADGRYVDELAGTALSTYFASYAPLASPTFTGTPAAPTPSTSDNSTRIATTAWVNNQGFGTGTGNVTGPSSATNLDLACYNGTTGKIIKDCGAALGTTGNAALLLTLGTVPTGMAMQTSPSQSDNSTDIATTANIFEHYQTIVPSSMPGATGDEITAAGLFATSLSIPGTNLEVGSTIKIEAFGFWNTGTTGSPVATFYVQDTTSSTTVCQAANVGLAKASNENAMWKVECTIQINTTGSSGTAYAWGQQHLAEAQASGTIGVSTSTSGDGEYLTSGGSGYNSGTYNGPTFTYSTAASQTIKIGENGTMVSGQSFYLVGMWATISNP